MHGLYPLPTSLLVEAHNPWQCLTVTFHSGYESMTISRMLIGWGPGHDNELYTVGKYAARNSAHASWVQQRRRPHLTRAAHLNPKTTILQARANYLHSYRAVTGAREALCATDQRYGTTGRMVRATRRRWLAIHQGEINNHLDICV